MNKAVHALVYVILAVAGVALYFEMNLFEKKELLKDSNEQLRNCIVDVSAFIEAEDATAAPVLDAKIDDDDLKKAEEIEEPHMDNLLVAYHPEYEKNDIKLMKWGKPQAAQLRKLYDLDSDGNKKPDEANPGKFITSGKGTAKELIDTLLNRAKNQYEKLGKTRQELVVVRTALQKLAGEYNKLTKTIRLKNKDIEKKGQEIETLKTEKAAVEDKLEKAKAEIEDQKTEIESIKKERDDARDETEVVKEDLKKEQEKVERLTNMLKTQTAAPRAVAGPVTGGGQLTSGNKGVISAVNNAELYVVVKFDDAALDELIGSGRNSPLPPHEMLVVREEKGADGKVKESIVGRIRLRQWTPKTNLVLADIMHDWQQGALKENDVVRPD